MHFCRCYDAIIMLFTPLLEDNAKIIKKSTQLTNPASTMKTRLIRCGRDGTDPKTSYSLLYQYRLLL